MEEFDEATPLRESYCSRLTAEEYEEQAARWVPIGMHASFEIPVSHSATRTRLYGS